MPTLVCLGDSITAKDRDPSGILKLTPRLQEKLPNWIIINAGISGDNTKNALIRLKTDVLSYNPDLVTVLLGTADASENKGIEIQEYEQNLTSIVEQITPQKTLLITSPPINQNLLLIRKKLSPKSNFVTMRKLGQYVAVMNKVASSTGSHFLDLWSIMLSQRNYYKFLKLKDGVHFNEKGYEFFTPLLSQKIKWVYSNI